MLHPRFFIYLHPNLILMEHNPLISVITVTYNAEKVIEKTVQSLAEQSFQDFEHLVIDGASKDQTVKKITESRVPGSRIVSEPDKGLYDAMNKGLRLAKGKYVIFLNAGDRFHDKSTLQSYAEMARQGADIIYGDTIIVDENGKKISDRHLSTPVFLTKDSFMDGMLICHQAFMVRKDLTSPYDISYRFSADYDWCIKCINASDTDKCRNLNSITIDYLQNGLTDNNKWTSLKERFHIMASYYGFTKTILKHLGFIFRAIKRGRI